MNILHVLLPGLDAYHSPHPLFVHFPVALFPVALLCALLALRLGRPLLTAARWLLLLGTLAMVPAIVTGLLAQGALLHGPRTTVASHRTFMLAAGGMALLLSLGAVLLREHDSRRIRLTLIGGLACLNAVIVLGADRGALTALQFYGGLGPAPPAAGEMTPVTSPAPPVSGLVEQGNLLYRDLACAHCHDEKRTREGNGIPPSLANAGSRLQSAWVQAYLRSPHRIRWFAKGVRPVARMPDFQLTATEAAALAAFMATRVDSLRIPVAPVTNPSLTGREAQEGRPLFVQYACRGCHSLGGSGGSLGPALDGVGSRLTAAYIYALLMDPRGQVPETAMKNFHLWDDEARALTAYLMSLRAERP